MALNKEWTWWVSTWKVSVDGESELVGEVGDKWKVNTVNLVGTTAAAQVREDGTLAGGVGKAKTSTPPKKDKKKSWNCIWIIVLCFFLKLYNLLGWNVQKRLQTD